MVKFARVLGMVLVAAVGFSGCSKEKSLDSTAGGGSGIIRMKIDGQQWIAQKIAGATIMNGYISIMGGSNDNKNLVIQIKTTATGTYQLDQVSDHGAVYVDNNEPVPLSYATNAGQTTSDAGGTVVITKIDEAQKRVSGTFTFKMLREIDGKSVMITEGVFENVPYTTELPPTGTSGALTAKIDGVDWTAHSVKGVVNPLNNSLTLIATDATGTKSINLIVPPSIQPGTYPLGDILTEYSGTYIVGPVSTPESYISVAGPNSSLTISEHSATTKTIKGTFFFDGQKFGGSTTIKITSGSFTIKY